MVNSVAKLSAGQVSYYLTGAEGKQASPEAVGGGHWWGAGAEELGLAPGSSVDPADLRELWQGKGPDGAPLKQLQTGSRSHTPGWDSCNSAPKSVSWLYATLPEGLACGVLRAHREANEEAFRLVNKEAFRCRVAGGEATVAAKPVVAMVTHLEDRGCGVQVHTHNLVMNLGRCPDGKWRALDSRFLFRAKMAVGAIYHAELAKRLIKLGYRLIPRAAGKLKTFEIEGVPAALVTDTAIRSKAITESLVARGIEPTPRARAIAALGTRPAKTSRKPEALAKEWKELAAKYGLTEEVAGKVARLVRGELGPKEEAATVTEALREVRQGEGPMPRIELIASGVAAVANRGFGARPVIRAIDEAIRTGELAVGRAVEWREAPALQSERTYQVSGGAQRYPRRQASGAPESFPARQRVLQRTWRTISWLARSIFGVTAISDADREAVRLFFQKGFDRPSRGSRPRVLLGRSKQHAEHLNLSAQRHNRRIGLFGLKMKSALIANKQRIYVGDRVRIVNSLRRGKVRTGVFARVARIEQEHTWGPLTRTVVTLALDSKIAFLSKRKITLSGRRELESLSLGYALTQDEARALEADVVRIAEKGAEQGAGSGLGAGEGRRPRDYGTSPSTQIPERGDAVEEVCQEKGRDEEARLDLGS